MEKNTVDFDQINRRKAEIIHIAQQVITNSISKEQLEPILKEFLLHSQEDATDFLFVYGTLMRKHPNHSLMKGARFIGEAVLENHHLVDLGSYPGAIPGNKGCIYGELYIVPWTLISKLDEYESEGSLYIRSDIQVVCEDKKYWAMTYLYNREVSKSKIIFSGRWEKEPGFHS